MVLFNQARRNRYTTGGFTLIELMLVIAIIGIIAVYATPKYQGLKEQYRLENSAQMVIAGLKYAKQLAMDQRTTTYVLVETDRIRVLQNNSGLLNEVDSKVFEQGVGFNYDPVEDNWMELTDAGGPIGHGVYFSNRGFVQNNGTIRLSSTHKEVGIDIEEETGYISIIWP